MKIPAYVIRTLFSLVLLAGVLLIAPGTPAGHTPAPATGSTVSHVTLDAVIHPAVPARPAAALDAHQLHLLHLTQEKAHAVLTAVIGSSRGAAALRWAVANASGHAYLFGGTGPSYDCSGLVMVAFEHEGISLPRTTEGMLGSTHLIRVSSPSPGDLAFFGTGHVEFYAGPDETFGAHHSGTTISYRSYGPGYEPTGFYRVR
jgi:NlpC/P60 family